MTLSDAILAAQGVDFCYPGGARTFGGLNLAVPRHGRLALLGANGAGKTTLLLLLAGALRPGRGAIALDGRPLAYDRRALLAWRQQVAVVLQDPDDQLFAATVSQDVSFGPLNLGLPPAQVQERVAEALAELELADLADRPTHMLSYGQRKRAAIAGAVAMRPRVLILDEPTAGLDARGVRQLLAVLERLHRAGTTLVLATHDMDLACAWATEAAVLVGGAVARQGPPAAVLADGRLVAAAGLATPRALELGLRLRELGWLAPGAPLPRTHDEIMAALPAPGRRLGRPGWRREKRIWRLEKRIREASR